MYKTKRAILSALFIVSVVLIFYLQSINAVKADIYSPFEENQDNGLTLTYAYDTEKKEESLTISVTGNNLGNSQFQYWIKRLIQTDGSAEEGKEATSQYVWQLVKGFETEVNSYKMEGIDGSYLDGNGNYSVLARIRDKTTGLVTDELSRSYNPGETGQPVIEQIFINGISIKDGNAAVNKESLLNISVKTNTGLSSYILTHNSRQISSSPDGIFENVDISFLKAGRNIIKLWAGSTGKSVEKYINLYVYDDYVSAERAVINSLESTAIDNIATFTMKLNYADGTPIDKDVFENDFKYSLVSSGTETGNKYGKFISAEENASDGMLDVKFSITYGEKSEGIYYIEGTVSRDGINGYDDRIIKYYGNSVRQAGISLSAASSGYNEVAKTYAAGTLIEITAAGNINGVADSSLEYAFYREDANGWILIRDYDGSPVLNWTPVKAGIYNIQARVKDINAAEYEKATTQEYKVSGVQLQGNLNVRITNYNTDDNVSQMQAGVPYMINAEYSGTENVFYMFTATTKNLSTVYLNNYSPSSYITYIPLKQEDVIFTARIIGTDNYGYKDTSLSVTISAYSDYFLERCNSLENISVKNSSYLTINGTVNDGNRTAVQMTATGYPTFIVKTYQDLQNAEKISYDIKLVSVNGDTASANGLFYLPNIHGSNSDYCSVNGLTAGGAKQIYNNLFTVYGVADINAGFKISDGWITVTVNQVSNYLIGAANGIQKLQDAQGKTYYNIPFTFMSRIGGLTSAYNSPIVIYIDNVKIEAKSGQETDASVIHNMDYFKNIMNTTYCSLDGVVLDGNRKAVKISSTDNWPWFFLKTGMDLSNVESISFDIRLYSINGVTSAEVSNDKGLYYIPNIGSSSAYKTVAEMGGTAGISDPSKGLRLSDGWVTVTISNIQSLIRPSSESGNYGIKFDGTNYYLYFSWMSRYGVGLNTPTQILMDNIRVAAYTE